MARYQYLMLTADRPEATVEQLNGYGADGWLLITIYGLPNAEDDKVQIWPPNQHWVYVFAREVPQ